LITLIFLSPIVERKIVKSVFSSAGAAAAAGATTAAAAAAALREMRNISSKNMTKKFPEIYSCDAAFLITARS